VADRGDRLARLGKVAGDLDDARVQANILRGAPAGQDERVVLLRLDLVEGGVEREVVPGLLQVGLLGLEIVDGGRDLVPGPLVRTDGVDRVSDHLQRLEWHHHLVIFDKITHEHQKLLSGHRTYSFLKIKLTEFK